MTAETWSPDMARQRLADYTIEDLFDLPGHTAPVELVDGVVRILPFPTFACQEIRNLLWSWLRTNAPRSLRPATSVGVAIDLQNTIEPDVVVLRHPTADRHYFRPDQVVLVVDVVSSAGRQAYYADVGIKYFWRIEQDPVHVIAYELVGDSYKLVADTTEELVLDRPFEIRLPIRDITP
jgi:Uma2 family endonuclease